MKFFSFSFFLLFSLSITFAQTDSLFISDFHDFIYTSADYYTSPLRFESEDWVRLSAVVGITVIASLADKEVKNFSQRNQSDFADAVLKIDKYYYAEFVGASIIAFYGYGLIAENSKIRKLAVKLTEATFLASSITLVTKTIGKIRKLAVKLTEATFLASSITLVTKTIVGRARPYQQESQYYFIPFIFDNDYNSFPSGHTTLAFAYSTVMANEIDNIFWKIGWYTAAGLVGYARIYHNQHWFSDVFMAAAIGYFSGEFVNNHHTNTGKNVSVNLYPMPMGLTVQVVF